MKAFVWLLVVLAVAIAQREIPVETLTGPQLLSALRAKQVCDAIPADALVNVTRRVTSHQWPDDAWWSWFELYGGHITCTDGHLWMECECVIPWKDQRKAVCSAYVSSILMRYSLRVAVRNPKHDDEPLAFVQAGDMTAVAKSAMLGLAVITRSDGGFRYIIPLLLGKINIGELTFEKSTIDWNGKEVDTTDALFGDPIRDALSDLVYDFIWGPLVDSLRKAFGDTNWRSRKTNLV
ncbi:uncharacterized protein LOC119377145 [Rhipicephalus sanguineus]|nr:uncharacterized protein LOC119377145 [Rhipicephalus sanguineus]